MSNNIPLNICFVGSTRYSNPLNATVDKKWRLLADLGEQISLIGFSDSWRPRRFTQHIRFILLPRLPFPPLRYLTFALFVPPLLMWRVTAGRADVLITQSPIDGAFAAFAKRFARLLGRRVILIVENHGNFEQSIFIQRRLTFGGIYKRLIAGLSGYALRHADLLRPVSSSTQAQLEKFAPQTPLVRFMAWTDSDVFAEAGTSPRRSLPSQSRKIVYIGVITPLKGIHVLLDAFASLPHDATLTLIGAQQDKPYFAELQQQAEKSGIAGRVTWISHIPQREVAAHMAAARLLVLPSFTEGLPRVIAEAMLTGLPVVATTVGGIPEIVQPDANGLLVPAGDAPQLADALRRILEDDAAADRFGAAGRAQALKSATSDAYVDGYRQLFALARGLL